MHKNIGGFTLVETLVSLLVLSIAILGFLQLDLHSQTLLQATSQQQQEQQQLQQFYEIVQRHNADNSTCPACVSLVRNQVTLRAWQQQLQLLMPNITVHYTVQSAQRLKLSFCHQDNRCDNFIIQV